MDDSARTCISALVSRDTRGHQFVVLADVNSGIPGEIAAEHFSALSEVLQQLSPSPEFILWCGDHVAGYTSDDQLRTQWQYLLQHEMAWSQHKPYPIYHVPGNHDTYDESSEGVFREMLPEVPQNGPIGQQGLSWWSIFDDMLLVGIDTCSSALGNGQLDLEWLELVLREHADIRHKVVFGHFPVFPVNGYEVDGAIPWLLEPAVGQSFWNCLVRYGVTAYFCAHIVAFDAQVHEGVLQIVTAGGGAVCGPGGMMGPDEYFHLTQVALDDEGMQVQTVDMNGVVREAFAWPICLAEQQSIPLEVGEASSEAAPLHVWHFQGQHRASSGRRHEQLLLSGTDNTVDPASIWIGLEHPTPVVTVRLLLGTGGMIQTWLGPALEAGAPFEFQIALDRRMGPGGVLYRLNCESPWSSLWTASSQGAERFNWPHANWPGCWRVGEQVLVTKLI